MSINAETAKEHANDPAVSCCRFEAGTVIGPENLEDPAILPDLEDSGLLTIGDDCLTIGQVLGATLTQTLEALTPMTEDMLKGMTTAKEESSSEASATGESVSSSESRTAAPASFTPAQSLSGPGGVVRIHIGEGKDIDLEFPLTSSQGIAQGQAPIYPPSETVQSQQPEHAGAVSQAEDEAKEVRKLVKKHYPIQSVALGNETKMEGTSLTIREGLIQEAIASEELVVNLSLEIITPDQYDTYSETIMDVQPIACKEEGELGSGVTRVIDGAVIMVTGTDENGVQIGEFGSSEGQLNRNIMWGRPGAPDKGEIFIKTQVTIKEKTNMERPGPLAAHKATDIITQEIREALKAFEGKEASQEEFVQYRRKNRKKVLIIKEIMGQGAMHDNLILPLEPVGTLGAVPNVDLGNVPVMLAPTEVVDGGIHALTCIGPASKETSRHYWREPLVLEAMEDEDIDLCGVLFVGSPQINTEKFYVSKRLGMIVEALDLDGAIITTEGFGNNHIDFASHHEQVGLRGVPVVGCTFSANQGALVVGNEYMTSMIDLNKSKQGIENEILSNNTLCKEDAVRALAMLKTIMAGGSVKAAERKWNPNVKLANVDALSESGIAMDLVENEQVLEKSKKRREIYEAE